MNRFTTILGMLAAAWPALASSPDLEDHHRVHMVPLRFETRATVRELAAPGIVFEIGAQAWRHGPFHIDTNVAFTPPHALGLVGPWRLMGSLDALVDWNIDLGPFLTVGPTIGAGWRMFAQQGTHVGDVFMPILGLRTQANLLRSRRFAMALTGRAMVDGRPVDLVLADSAIERLSPVAVQVGLRFVFGHGRPR